MDSKCHKNFEKVKDKVEDLARDRKASRRSVKKATFCKGHTP